MSKQHRTIALLAILLGATTIPAPSFADCTPSFRMANLGGFGNRFNLYAWSMQVFNDRLYVGTFNQTTGGEIWAYDGAQWTREYDAILGEEQPFAVIVNAAQRPQPPAGKPMALWMKSRKAQLGAWVCATVYIVEDDALRADFERTSDKRQKASPYPMAFVATEAEALAAARAALT